MYKNCFLIGEERWKVDELGLQGQNVNQWHWEEKDCKLWSRNFLNQEFKDFKMTGIETGYELSATGV